MNICNCTLRLKLPLLSNLVLLWKCDIIEYSSIHQFIGCWYWSIPLQFFEEAWMAFGVWIRRKLLEEEGGWALCINSKVNKFFWNLSKELCGLYVPSEASRKKKLWSKFSQNRDHIWLFTWIRSEVPTLYLARIFRASEQQPNFQKYIRTWLTEIQQSDWPVAVV